MIKAQVSRLHAIVVARKAVFRKDRSDLVAVLGAVRILSLSESRNRQCGPKVCFPEDEKTSY